MGRKAVAFAARIAVLVAATALPGSAQAANNDGSPEALQRARAICRAELQPHLKQGTYTKDEKTMMFQRCMKERLSNSRK